MLLLNFKRKTIDDFQITPTYKKACSLLQKTGFSLNITDWIKKDGRRKICMKF